MHAHQPPPRLHRSFAPTLAYQPREKPKIEQFEAFKKARKEVPSGKGDAYWEKIAARVPGQNAAACKRVAESMLFEAAVGTKSNYFGGYIETIETPDYVDPEADIMFKINKLFGRGKK